MSFRFPKSARLLNKPAFDRVFAQRCSKSDRRLVLYAAPSEQAAPGKQVEPRMGLVVSRRVGNSVVRNRWKRRLREAFRIYRQELPANFDYVVLPKGRVLPTVVELSHSLLRLSHGAADAYAKRSGPSKRSGDSS